MYNVKRVIETVIRASHNASVPSVADEIMRLLRDTQSYLVIRDDETVTYERVGSIQLDTHWHTIEAKKWAATANLGDRWTWPNGIIVVISGNEIKSSA